MKSIDWSSFISNIISVVLGIVITFGIQGLIDRHREKTDVMSALELVKEELMNNRASLEEAIGIIDYERDAAAYVLDSIAVCSVDTLNTLNQILGNEYYFTVTDDALELLKSSSLFSKINDKNLALGIIKSYDYLGAGSGAFNTHEGIKSDLYQELNTDEVKKASISQTNAAFMKKFFSSKDATYFLFSVKEMSNSAFLKDGIPEIEATIAAIESRLK